MTVLHFTRETVVTGPNILAGSLEDREKESIKTSLEPKHSGSLFGLLLLVTYRPHTSSKKNVFLRPGTFHTTLFSHHCTRTFTLRYFSLSKKDQRVRTLTVCSHQHVRNNTNNCYLPGEVPGRQADRGPSACAVMKCF